MAQWLIEHTIVIHELISVIVILAITYLSTHFLLLKLTEQKESNHINESIQKIITPLLGYTIALLFLAIDAVVTNAIYQSNDLVVLALQITVILTISKIAQLLSKSKAVFWISLFAQVAHRILFKFELTEQIISVLDQYSLNLGPVHLTPSVVIKTVIILVLMIWIASGISQGLKDYLKSLKGVRMSTRILLSKIGGLSIYLISGLVVMHSLGISLTTLTVLGGAVGVGIGFGLQKIASNYISGLILLLEKSIEVGDLIEVSNKGGFGTVKHIGGRYTLVEMADFKEVLIPNEDFITNQVSNWTYSNTVARIEIKVSVEYGSDLNQVKTELLQAAVTHSKCLKTPEPLVFLREFGDSSVNFTLFFFVSDVMDGLMAPQSEVMFEIWARFENAGILIAYPHQNIKIQGPVEIKQAKS